MAERVVTISETVAALNAAGYEAGARKIAAANDQIAASEVKVERAATNTEAAIDRQLRQADRVYAAELALARARGLRARAEDAGSTGLEKARRLEMLREQQLQRIVEMERRHQQALGQTGRALGLTSQQLGNLSFQLNDIATGLLSGQSPFMILAQQGGQVVQVFGGVRGTMSTIAAGFRAISPVALGAAAGIAAIGTALAVGLAQAAKFESAVRAVNVQLAATGRAALGGGQVGNLLGLSASTPGLDRAGAASGLATLAGNRLLDPSLYARILTLAPDLARALGTDLAGAFKTLSDVGANAAGSIGAVDDKLGILDAASLRQIQTMQALGDRVGAADLAYQKIQERVRGLAEQGMSPLESATDGFSRAWGDFLHRIGQTGPIQAAYDAVTGLVRAMTPENDIEAGARKIEAYLQEYRRKRLRDGQAAADEFATKGALLLGHGRPFFDAGSAGSVPPAANSNVALSAAQIDALANKYNTIDAQTRDLTADFNALNAAILAGADATGAYAQALGEIAGRMANLKTPLQQLQQTANDAWAKAGMSPQQRALFDGWRAGAAANPSDPMAGGIEGRRAAQAGLAQSAADTMRNLKAETAGRLAIADAIAKGAGATMKARAEAQAHAAVVGGLAINEKAYAAALLASAEAQAKLDLAERRVGLQDDIKLKEAELQLLREMPGAVESTLGPLRLQLELQQKYGELLPEAQADLVELAKKQGQLNDQIAATKRENELMMEPLKSALQSVQSSFADFYADVLQGGINSFRDLAGRVKGIFIRLAAEMAALMTIRPVLGAVASGFFGSGIATSLGFAGGSALGGAGAAGATAAGGANTSGAGLAAGAGLFGGGITNWLNGLSLPGGQPLFTSGAAGFAPGSVAADFLPASLSGQAPGVTQGFLPFSAGQGLAGLGAVTGILGAISNPNPLSIAGAGAGVLNAAGAFGMMTQIPYIGQIALALQVASMLFGGAFKKQSVGPGGGVFVNAGAGGLKWGGGVGDNGFDAASTAGPWADAIIANMNAFGRNLGGTVTGFRDLPMTEGLNVGYDAGRKTYNVGDQHFEKPEEFLTKGLVYAIQHAEWQGIGADIALAIRNSTAENLDQLAGDVGFAKGFRDQLGLWNAAANPRDMQAQQFRLDAVKAADEAATAFTAFLDRTKALFGGAETEQFYSARGAARNQALATIGIRTDAAGNPLALSADDMARSLTGLAATLAQGAAQIDAYRDVLLKLGMDADDITRILATAQTGLLQRTKDNYLTGLGDTLFNLQNPQAGAFQAIANQRRQGYADLDALTNLSAAERRLAEAQIDEIVRLQIAAQVTQERVAALQDEASAAQAAQQASQSLYDTLNRYRTGLLTDRNLSPLSPTDQLAEAQRQFDAAILAAGANDNGRPTEAAIKAAAQIPDLQTRLLEQARAYYASSTGYAEIFNRAQAATLGVETMHKSVAEQQLEVLKAINDNIAKLSPAAANQNRNWGATPDQNRALAAVSGYAGDFGAGGFGRYIVGQSDPVKEAARQIVRAYGGVPGFAEGGSFMVGGVGGTDSQLVQFRASPNERVTITPPSMMPGSSGDVTATLARQQLNALETIAQLARAEVYEANESRKILASIDGRLARQERQNSGGALMAEVAARRAA